MWPLKYRMDYSIFLVSMYMGLSIRMKKVIWLCKLWHSFTIMNLGELNYTPMFHSNQSCYLCWGARCIWREKVSHYNWLTASDIYGSSLLYIYIQRSCARLGTSVLCTVLLEHWTVNFSPIRIDCWYICKLNKQVWTQIRPDLGPNC